MKRKMVHVWILMTLLPTLCMVVSRMLARSMYRKTILPQLTTRWTDDTICYHLQHNNLESASIFDQYDEAYFQKHMLPDAEIHSRDGSTTTRGSEIKTILEELVHDLQSTTRHQFRNKHFTVLKRRDYNPKTHSGLMVLKCKDYPYVVKLFMETPKSFVCPFSKGFEPCCFFVMSGGTSRYLLGFSRLKNRETIQKKIAAAPDWCDKISVPRKWFWRPKNTRWLEVSSKYLGTCDRTTVLPSVYAIICDAIDAQPFQITHKEDRKTAIELSHLLGTCIDSHIDNFLVEESTGKFVIIDTEHFATQVGLRKPIEFDGYPSWYWQLATKCIGNSYLRTKKERLFYQTTPPPIIVD